MYTVLMEGDDLNDPVAGLAKSILDGHYVLSRKLANSGHFPAIDILASVSRVMNDVVPEQHLSLAQEARDIIATYQESSDLIDVGAYKPGSNPKIDRAILLHEPLNQLLRQKHNDVDSLDETVQKLNHLLNSTRSENAQIFPLLFILAIPAFTIAEGPKDADKAAQDSATQLPGAVAKPDPAVAKAKKPQPSKRPNSQKKNHS